MLSWLWESYCCRNSRNQSVTGSAVAGYVAGPILEGRKNLSGTVNNMLWLFHIEIHHNDNHTEMVILNTEY